MALHKTATLICIVVRVCERVWELAPVNVVLAHSCVMICASFSSFSRFSPAPAQGTNNLGSPTGLCHTINKSFYAREKK